MSYRVYNANKVPIEGGEYFDVNSQRQAIELIKKLSDISKEEWTWSKLG